MTGPLSHRSAAAAALVLLAPGAVLARELPTPNAQQVLSGSRALGMGNAFRAVATTNEALYFNLAGLSQTSRYELDLQYGFDNGRDLQAYNGSIVDATTQVATGLAYTRLLSDGTGGEQSGGVVNLGFGIPIGEAVSIGIGAKYLGFSKPEDTNAITGDAGLLIRPTGWLSIGAAYYNFVNVFSREAPRSAGVGVAFGDDTWFRLAGDAAFDFSGEGTDVSYHAGGEYLLGGAFPVRAGFQRFADQDRNYVTAGLGFVSPRIGLDAAYLQNLEADESGDRLFSFTLKVFL